MDGEEWNFQGLSELLAKRLAAPLPGRLTQRAMAPELAYGRHHGPAATEARQAAVLVPIVPHSLRGWSIPAVLRPTHMKTHAGQVSLPGGSVDPGETAEMTALREFEEELGVPRSAVQVLGRLSPIYVFLTDFLVTPVVAIAPQPLQLHPSPAEVAAVVDLPLDDLTNPLCRSSHRFQRRGLTFHAPHFAIGGQRVWGATGLILAEFAALLPGAEAQA